MSELPLSDVRVLDLTRLLPGGFCSQLLADFGADVVKVEDTGMGDYIRWAPPYYGDDEQQALGTRSALYLSLNRNKRSIRLDLKSEGGRDALLRLVARVRRRARELPPRRPRPARRRLRADARRRTRRSSTARSPATARPGRTRSAPATT